MAFNVSNFRALISDGGVLRNNKFRVRFNLPMGLVNFQSQTSGNNARIVRELEYWATGSSLPPIGLETYQANRYGYGMPEKRPHGKNFTDVRVSFIVDEFSEKWKFFEEWLNMIYNSNMAAGINGYTSVVSQGFMGSEGALPVRPYELSYKDEYITDVRIEVFTETGELSNAVVLREAFPITMSGLDFDWADNNSFNTVGVTFAFTDIYRVNFI